MQIQLAEDQIQLCGVIPQCIQHGQESGTQQKLRCHLLPGSKPQVLLLDCLDVVIRKADAGKQQREHHACDQPQHAVPDLRIRAVLDTLGAIQHIPGDHRDHGADDKHKTTHNGGTLLVLVPTGANLQNRLSEVDLLQIRNQNPADGSSEHCGQQRCC